MSLVSVQFLLFLLSVAIIYYIVPRNKQWIVLLVASYSFYLLGGITPLIFILSTTVTVYLAGLIIDKNNRRSEKKSIAKQKNKKIVVGVVLINFGILLLLKYVNFIASNIGEIFTVLEYNDKEPLINIVLPLGISFYTFQAVGYVIDLYRGKYRAERDLAKFALFISFFPQMIQGPIGRYDSLGPQLTGGKAFDYEQVKAGAQLMLWGFLKKMVLADRAAIVVRQVFPDYGQYDGLQVAITIVLYAIQIYADFSGGIDIARGAAQTLGIELAENFERPYFGNTVSEYWRRWHMSLTNWMRDYVFFPMTISKTSNRLGKWGRAHIKNSIGKQLPSYPATFIVFLLIGIWHGAGWGYIVYGLYNGTILVAGMALRPVFDKMLQGLHIREGYRWWRLIQIIRTFIIMCIGKCIVRADSVSDGIQMVAACGRMFDFTDFKARLLGMGLDENNWIVLSISLAVLFIVSLIQEHGIHVRSEVSKLAFPIQWVLYLVGFAIVLVYGVYGPGYDASEFIYRNY